MNELFFWFNIPPKVEKGAFNFVASHWPTKVYYVILNDLPEYRKTNGWDDKDYGGATIIELWKYGQIEERVQRICSDNPDAIHIVNGFTGPIQRIVRKTLRGKKTRIGVYTERPAYYGNLIKRWIRRLFLFIKYSFIRIQVHNRTDFVLALGQQGVRAFRSFGWENKKLFCFMYNPNISFIKRNVCQKNGPVRFAYVGRFYFPTKGVDVLMKACERLTGDWTMDFVGGYGKDSQTVKRWINKQEKVHFVGSWKAKDVVHNLGDYDIVVIPSKCDGWNLLANESMAAGIGCIISDQAVSQEIVIAGKTGLVYHWRDAQALANCMQSIINDPELCLQYSINVQSYRSRINSETVGKYLLDILDYVYSDDTDCRVRPQCPWL